MVILVFQEVTRSNPGWVGFNRESPPVPVCAQSRPVTSSHPQTGGAFCTLFHEHQPYPIKPDGNLFEKRRVYTAYGSRIERRGIWGKLV